MNVVLQKVLEASVEVNDREIARIGQGYLLLVGIAAGDTDDAVQWLARKIADLRLFPGDDGKINDKTIKDTSGSILAISQFTLLGSVEKANRPDYTAAAPRDEALRLYDAFVQELRGHVNNVQTGEFGAHMQVSSINDGPVTILLHR